jgi:hypothetical protein
MPAIAAACAAVSPRLPIRWLEDLETSRMRDNHSHATIAGLVVGLSLDLPAGSIRLWTRIIVQTMQ